MTLNAAMVSKTTARRAEMPAGTYPCRVVHIVDLGVQPQNSWGEVVKPPREHILLTYEFTDEFMPDDNGEPDTTRPRFLSEVMPLFPLTAERAKSTLRYQALDPRNQYQGDWSQLVGTPCNVSITLNPGKGHNLGKMYENITGVQPMREKDRERTPELVNDPIVFTLDSPDYDAFVALPEWVRRKVIGGIGFDSLPFSAEVKAKGAGLTAQDPEAIRRTHETHAQRMPEEMPDETPY